MDSNSPVTALLGRSRSGDEAAHAELVEVVYPELQRLARRHLGREGPGHTLSSTALVHEAYLRLADAGAPLSDRTHFFAVAARIMRHILVDHARGKRREKRGGDRRRVTLKEALLLEGEDRADIADLDEALVRLAALDERKARVVELHFFGGLTYEETAEVLQTSRTAVNRDLRFAKAWLHDLLTS